jgi:uncharacterized protein (TIGR02145 family)
MQAKFLAFGMALCAACLNVTSQNLPDYVPSAGIVGWFPFDGNCEDLSMNDFDGTPVNAMWGQNRFGVPDAALDLSAISDDYVDLPMSLDSIFTSQITVSCWVNYPAIQGQTIFQNGPTPGLYDKCHALIWDQASTGNMTVRLYSESSSYASYEYEADEEWKHLVMVLDDDSASIFVNGEMVHESGVMPFVNSPGVFRIGEAIFGNPYNYRGQIDEFGIWDRALDPIEIWGLYNGTAPIIDCLDEAACNYNAEADFGDQGSCLYQDVIGDCGGYCESDQNDNDICDSLEFGPCEGLTSYTYNGYTYPVVAIGSHCWFQENLRSETFRNGQEIPYFEENSNGWYSQSLPRFGKYNDSDSLANIAGLIYNYSAVVDANELCPSGWHVPISTDFNNVVDSLGYGSLQFMAAGLASQGTGYWEVEIEGTNETAMTIQPFGSRSYLGEDNTWGVGTSLWCASTELPQSGQGWNFHPNTVTSNLVLRSRGRYVRCIKGEFAFGCTNPAFAEYDNGAEMDNGSCVSLLGCTDEAACNYNPEAIADEEFCLYDDSDGDGICDYEDDCVGGIDSCGICNGPGEVYECGCFDPPLEPIWCSCGDIAEGDCDCDGNELDALGICGGWCEEDANGNGICDCVEANPEGACGCGIYVDELGECGGDVFYGCTYAFASNFDENATLDDGSCVLPGCTDAMAINYNPSAQTDDTSCLYAGCTDPEAVNYVVNTDDSGYVFTEITHDVPYPLDYGAVFTQLYDDWLTEPVLMDFDFELFGVVYSQFQVSSNGYLFFDESASSGGYSPWQITGQLPSDGLPFPAIFAVYNDMDPSTCGTIHYGIDGEAPQRKWVISWNELCVFESGGYCEEQYVSAQLILHESVNAIEFHVVNRSSCSAWNDDGLIIGLQNEIAAVAQAAPGYNNENPDVNERSWLAVPLGAQDPNFDDGSCLYAGCMDPIACNFQSDAIENDDTCIYVQDSCGSGTLWDQASQACVPDPSCPTDVNQDGFVSIVDLLMLLADFGSECSTDLDE